MASLPLDNVSTDQAKTEQGRNDPGKGPHLDSILKIPVAVQVFLGSASMPISDLMKLGRGAVVALDHAISDPVDVVVNGRVIARGELVAMDDDPTRIGVKLTEIIGRPDAG